MPLTVADVLELPDLALEPLAGAGGLDRHVRWAHVIELADPVPWLRGGELVLTVGLGIPEDAAGQQAYVHRLVAAGCAGLGFAVGELLDRLPAPVLDVADEVGFPVLGVLGDTPFIAVTEAVARWHADERSRHERLAIDAQDAMARAALRSGHGGVLRELARGTGGETVLLDSSGHTLVATPRRPRDWHDVVRDAVLRSAGSRGAIGLTHADCDVHVQSIGTHGMPRGWLAVRCPHPAPAHVRLLANHAAALVGVGVEGLRVARATTHRQRGVVFGAALDGGGDLAWRRVAELCPLPPAPYEVLVFHVPGVSAAGLAGAVLDALADVLADPRLEERTVVCPRPEGLVAVLPMRADPLGPLLVRRLDMVGGYGVRAGAARAGDRSVIAGAIARAAGAIGDGESGYRNADDIGAWQLLREAMDPAGIQRFTDAVLERLLRHAGDDRPDTVSLVECLRAFLDQGGNLEAAARALGVHRNTLRSRLRKAERLSGRSLSDPRARLELWLAVTMAAENP